MSLCGAAGKKNETLGVLLLLIYIYIYIYIYILNVLLNEFFDLEETNTQERNKIEYNRHMFYNIKYKNFLVYYIFSSKQII